MKQKIENVFVLIFGASIYGLLALWFGKWPLHNQLQALPNHWWWLIGVLIGTAVIVSALDGSLFESSATSSTSEARTVSEFEARQAAHKPSERVPVQTYQVQMLWKNSLGWTNVTTAMGSDAVAIGYIDRNRNGPVLRDARAVRVIETNSKQVVWSG